MSASASTSTPAPAPDTPQSLLKDSMREIFLWRRKKLSFSVLAISTVMWVLLEIYQYTFVTVASWVAILTVASLFVWAHLAPLLGRDVPSCSGLEVSEQSAVEIADAVQSWVEDSVRYLFHVAVERNWLVVAQIITALLILSFIGSCFDFLTLLYIGILMGFTLPVLYFKYQDRIQACVERVKMDGRKLSERVKMDGRKLSEMVDEKILRKIKKKVSKEKKTE
ncbi:reticulon-like protein B13 isoform X2 [Magnolia sinica]|uniref:reticulon-like protein B13 isoform X2 n=1 Tax=Magnolia sinica TaxID=86752 RepID=UPI00265A242F|nr:reticulon-like protein B13 isoform X2 [Magnolia sinica]